MLDNTYLADFRLAFASLSNFPRDKFKIGEEKNMNARKIWLTLAIVLVTISIYAILNLVKADTSSISGTFNTANIPCNYPAGIALQNNTNQWMNATSETSTNNMTTHMAVSILNWTQSTDSNGDYVNNTLCVSDTYPITTCNIVNNVTNTTGCNGVSCSRVWTFVTGNLSFSSTLNNGWYNKTYYVWLMCQDNATSWNSTYFNFTLENRQPVAPSNLKPDTNGTHITTPLILWTASTDADIPADTLTYNYTMGTTLNGTEIAARTSTSNNYFTSPALSYGTTITGGSSNPAWVNKTYYISVWTSDSSGGTSGNITGTNTPILYNRLPTSVTTGWTPTQTHTQNPSVSWTGVTDLDSDTFTYNTTEGDAYGQTQYVNTESASASSGNNFGASVTWGAAYSNGWVNKTVYVSITTNDTINPTLSDTAYHVTWVLYDKIPTAPSTFNLTTATGTHDRTPDMSWTDCTTTDGDTITRYTICGSADNLADYLSTNPASSTFAWGTNTPITWGAAESGAGWVNRSVYCTLWCKDNSSGIQDSSNNYTTADFTLYDRLPIINWINITSPSQAWSNMAISPMENMSANFSVQVLMNDLDGDCAANRTSYAMICLNKTGAQACTDSSWDYSFNLTTVTAYNSSNSCNFTYTLATSASDVNTSVPFWVNSSVYKLHINESISITSDVGPAGIVRASDIGNLTNWTYNSLKAIWTPSSFNWGTISLNTWNNISLGNVSNTGNTLTYVDWNATNFTSGGNICNIDTTCQLHIADAATSKLAEVTLNSSAVTTGDRFQPTYGLNTTVVFPGWIASGSAVIGDNASYPIWFKINPPLGLPSGAYSGTILAITE